MPVFGSQWFAATDTAYTINKSIRFNDDDSAYLTRTPSSDGDRQTMTFSWWMKRSNIDISDCRIFTAKDSNDDQINFADTGDKNRLDVFFDGTSGGRLTTEQAFNDVAAWYHCVVAIDTTQSTAGDRVKIYVNGNRVTDFSTETQPSLNKNLNGFNNNDAHAIGARAWSGAAGFYDGYLAEIVFIDGQQLDASSFGETNSDTGQWVPIDVSGLTFGSNGYYLKGQDSSALGDDTSGNGNDFTSSGLAAADQMSDSPTDNFCTLSPIDKYSPDVVLSDGNLIATSGSGWHHGRGTFFAPSGKWYYEWKSTSGSYAEAGWMTDVAGSDHVEEESDPDTTYYRGIGTAGRGVVIGDGSPDTGPANFSTNDIVMMAIDIDTMKFWVGVNGTWYNSGDPANGTNATGTWSARLGYSLSPWYGLMAGSSTFNFGQSSFSHTIPAGFKPWSTAGLDDPQVENPSKFFHTQLYTGDGSSGHAITNNAQAGDFKPDLLIIAPRSNGDHHNVWDAVRGNTKRIRTNEADTEYTDSPAIITFESDGFDLDTTDVNYNGSSRTYCAWQWSTDGASAATNTDGSRDSSVMVNTTHGFSIVAYTGDGSGDDTYGHGLGTTPGLIWCKNLDAAQNWRVFNQGLTNGAANSLFLNLNNAESADSDRISAVSSTTFTAAANMNKAEDYIAYCWTPVPGYSAFGNYEGNSSDNGTFVPTGFRPAWIVVKTMDSANDWVIYDSKRDPFNVSNTVLRMETNATEFSGSGRDIDILSNGFKMRTSNGTINASATFAYMAFAEFPFKYANAR